MGEEPARTMSDEELDYYRAVEDHFALLRGTPFLFTPKDFALLRKWWQGGVPLAAALAGIGEVFEQRREREADPVSSLSYCRHAVARHAKRLAAAHVGATAFATNATIDVAGALASLRTETERVAAAWREDAAVSKVLSDLRYAIAGLPTGGDPAALEETLAGLEFTTLDALFAALPPTHRDSIATEVERELGRMPMAEDVRTRTRRALLIKATRRCVGLPRLELRSDAG